jgi:GTP-binding protein Era
MTDWDVPPNHRSGYVALAGRPNVGKSTLINHILGQKVTSVSPKPQTTRRRQLGILTLPDAQIIFVDTPGIHQPVHKLGERLNADAKFSLEDANMILVIFDVSLPPHAEDRQVASVVLQLEQNIPRLMLLNKMDLVSPPALDEHRQAYQDILPDVETAEVSATRGDGLKELIERIVALMPDGPRYFPTDEVTDRFERDIAADLIRAVCLQLLRDEVPHCIAIRIDQYKDRNEHGAYIEATIFVERDSQKGIVIGKNGTMLKRIGTLARQQIEEMTDRKVYLQLRVKVLKGWRNDEAALKKLGY